MKTNHKYKLDCVSILEADPNIVRNEEVSLQVEWLSRYGHTLYASIVAPRLKYFIENLAKIPKEHHKLVKVVTTAIFDDICHGFYQK